MGKPFLVPLLPDGSLCDSDYGKFSSKVPNFEFEETLTFVGMVLGNAQFVDTKRRKYQMFPVEFEAMLLGPGLQGQDVTGVFTFVRKGIRYGVKYVRRNQS